MKRKNIWLWLLAGIFWTIVIGVSTWYENNHSYNDIISLASIEGRSSYNKELAYRRWAAGHGGVYVPVTKETPPNPYLKNIPERDLVTPSGRRLTLLNPAYMTRQVYELAEGQYGVGGHITSLKPLRPENIPDSWETEALQSFEEGATSAQQIAGNGDQSYLRLMFPMMVDKGCLKCHGAQGYRLGDVRGGISVSVPLAPYQAASRETLATQNLYHAGVWLLGIFGLFLGWGRVCRQFSAAEAALDRSQTAEKELLRQKSSFEKVQELGMVGGWALDLTQNQLSCSKEVLRIFGVNTETETGYELWRKKVHVEDGTYVDRQWRAALEGERYDIEYRLTVDAEIKWVREKADFTFDEDGRALSALGFTQDITERKRIDETLYFIAERGWISSDEDFFPALVQYLGQTFGIDFAIINKIADEAGMAETVALYAQGEIVPNLRYSLRDTPCHNVMDKKLCCYPQDVQRHFPKDQMLVDMQVESYVGIPLWSSDGRPLGLIAVMDSKPIRNTKLIKSILQLLATRAAAELERMLTEETLRVQVREYEISQKLLKESEERFKTLHDATFGGVIILDKGRIIDCNQGLIDMTDYSREELIGMDSLKLMAPDSRGLARQNIEINSSRRYEAEGVRKDGSTYPLSLRGGKIHHKDYELRVVELRDLTELKQAEQERKTLETHLQQAHKMEAIGTMAGGIAHDFNNLLAIIMGNVGILQRKYHNEDCSNFVKNIDHIGEAAERAANLVRQILSFSRQEQTRLTQVDLAEILDNSLKLLRSTLPATIEITNQHKTGPVFIHADTTQLQQVFINLCTNAVHAMNEEGLLRIELGKTELCAQEISAISDQPAGSYAKLSISDNGCGMNKETANKIFDPFFTTKEPGKGTGMGLSVVHGIVTQHSGFITVDSTPALGTTFNVYFPLDNKAEAELKTESDDPLPRGTERVLFVDDEENVAAICTEMLRYLGYQVTSVTSSIEALDIFKADPQGFDLVFTDQTMPEMSGAELIVKLLKIRPALPIILCSGYSSKVSKKNAKQIGVREFCTKPLAMQQLARVARQVLDEQHQ